MECTNEENAKQCACTYPSCPRRGNCCECVKYHRDRGELPGCFFSRDAERTYDRSMENFIRSKRL